MAGWAAAAGAAASVVPSILGKDGGNKTNPWQQAQAGLVAQNPNQDTFWGGTQLITDHGKITSGDDSERDDTYTIRQTQSPQMQALSQALAGRAGASRGTFTSGGMPDHLKDRYAFTMYNQGKPMDERTSFSERGDVDLSGYMPAESSYQRPEFAFGVGDGPAQVGDGQPEPADYGNLNNAQAFDLVQREGLLSPDSISWINEAWNADPSIRSGDAIAKGNWSPYQEGVDLTPENRGHYQSFIDALAQLGVTGPKAAPEISTMPVGEKFDLPADYAGYTTPANEPNPANTNQAALNRFIQSMGGIR